MSRMILTSLALAGLLAVSAPPPPAPEAPPEVPALGDDSPREFDGLHNVVAYHEGYLSGSVPEGDAGFDTLARMGVKTIISVDGAAPKVELARARGMRYIHLPIGYNGFDEARKLQLVRATRDALADGPVYIHCHHGKHRSAGAAAAVVASLGWMTPQQAVERMKVSGTAPQYQGLYKCAAEARVIDAEAIDRVPADFPEVSHPETFVKSMVEIEHALEHLGAIERAGWRVPRDHPDLVPAAEAGRMADLFRVLTESEKVKRRPADFVQRMTLNAQQAQELEDLLLTKAMDGTRLSAQFALIQASCNECHAKYRD